MPAFRILHLLPGALALALLAAAPASAADEHLFATGITLLDPRQKAAPRTRYATLVIADDTIVYAGPSGLLPPSDGARDIDGTRLESTAHADRERALRNLMAGMEAQGTPLDPAALRM
ncbi:hypothetical protein [Novosphingobium sp. MBES04]|uniref:hypothetical protein n=1 Tax=Novosphingobium sp. MBES04 TaxID=1206458 RepID=UPI00057C70B6|nr:hypothetical protein [Novosphingobium sp. MBES04]GAM06500.1 hypothetical protein MBENS4_3497 [Novosphingobium sp. MBES04]